MPAILERVTNGWGRARERIDRWLPRGAVNEAVTLWGICFAAIVVTFVVLPVGASLVATVGFLYLPVWSMDRRNEDYRDYGVDFRGWKKDVAYFVVFFVVIAPVFIFAYRFFVEDFLPILPETLRAMLAPYLREPHYSFKLPDHFERWVVHEFLVVALPEEFFYRGFIQTRLNDAWPHGPKFFGVRVGKAFWLTAVLFALGHLAIFQTWRLGVFFPALLFGWLREKTGSIVAAALLHASSNLLMHVLEASYFGTL